MPICSKTSSDPLMQLLHARYGINLLALPVGQCEVGELIISRDGKTLRCDFNTVFATPRKPSFGGGRNDEVAPIDDTFSNELNAKVGAGILDKLLPGAPAARAKLASKYGSASKVRVRVTSATCDKADLVAMDRAVRAAKFREAQTLYRDGDQLFIVQAVYRGLGLEVKATAQDGAAVEVTAAAEGVGEADVHLSGKRIAAGTVSWKHKTPLAFGVALLTMVPEKEGWRLDIPDEVIQVRGDVDLPVEHLTSILGPDGDAFVELEQV